MNENKEYPDHKTEEVLRQLEKGDLSLEQALSQLRLLRRQRRAGGTEEEILEDLRAGRISLQDAFNLVRKANGKPAIEFPPEPAPEKRRISKLGERVAAWQAIRLQQSNIKWQAYLEKRKSLGPAKSLGVNLLWIMAIEIIVIALLWPITALPGFGPGSDTPSHAYIATRLGEYLKQTGDILLSDRYWYNQLYLERLPPLTYVPLVGLYLVTGDPYLTARIFYLALPLVMLLIIFLVFRKTMPNLNAALGALLMVLSPICVGSGFSLIDSFTRFTAFLFFPLVWWSAEQIFAGRTSHRWLLSLWVALMLLAHPMVAALTIFWLLLYAVGKIIFVTQVRGQFTQFLISIAIGSMLASWYLLPFFFEQEGWGAQIPASVFELNSASPKIFIANLGYLLIIVAIAGTVIKSDRPRKVIFATTVFFLLYSLGIYGPLAYIGPLRFAYPFLALYIVSFFLIYLAVSSLALIDFPLPRNKILAAFAMLSLAALIMAEFGTVPEVGKPYDFRFNPDERRILKRVAEGKGGGRTMPVGYPYGMLAHGLYFLAKAPSPEGQYTTIAPFYVQIANFYELLEKGYQQKAASKLAMWNANQVVVLKNIKQKKDLRQKRLKDYLAEMNFKLVYQDSYYKLYRRDPFGYFQTVTPQALAIGQFSLIGATVFPSTLALESSVFLDDYPLEVLKTAPGLVLSGAEIKNEKKAFSLVKDYLQWGGQIIVDMQPASDYQRFMKPEFLGVRPQTVRLNGKVTFHQKGLEKILPLKPVKVKNWYTVAYKNLDVVLLRAENRKQSWAVFGYKKIGGKRVYFIGHNILFHAYNRPRGVNYFFLNRFFNRLVPERKVEAPLKPEVATKKGAFIVKNPHERPILIILSFAYSPHWQTHSSEKRAGLFNVEGQLGLFLPPRSKAEISWGGNAGLHYLALGVSVVGLLILAYLAIRPRLGRPRKRLEE